MNMVNEHTRLLMDDPDRYFPEDLDSIDHAAAIIWGNIPCQISKGMAVKVASKVYDGLREMKANQARLERSR